MCRMLAVTILAMFALAVAGCFHDDQPPTNAPVTEDLAKRQVEDPLIAHFTDSDWKDSFC